jgi:hypothetical protein
MKKLLLSITIIISIFSCKKEEIKPVTDENQIVANRLCNRWFEYAISVNGDCDTLDTQYQKIITTFSKPNIFSLDVAYYNYNTDSVLVPEETNYSKGTWEILNNNILKIYSTYYNYTYGYDSIGNYIVIDSVLTENNKTQTIKELYDSKLTLQETFVVDDTTSLDVIIYYKKYSE